MVRSFTSEPVDAAILDRLLEVTLGGPKAGNTHGLHVVALVGEERSRYWDVALPPPARATFPWPGLLLAPVLVIVYVEPARYLDRYSEADKGHTGLGHSADEWIVPYWWVDAGAAIGNLLLAAVAHGLGACLFGQFEHEDAVRSALQVPATMRAAGSVALGHPDRSSDRPSRSARRGRPDPARHVHRGRW